jgi:uncharacterized protein (TIGR01777 family)
MRIVVSGGTGFLGRAVVPALRADGHDVATLTRRKATDAREVTWSPDGSVRDWGRVLDGADAVINLAGESIGARRWTAAEKSRIHDSRLLATRSLVRAIAQASHPPALLISGSAVGYYGSRGDEVITEQSGPGADFLSDVCRAWETEAASAEQSGTRVTFMRTGVVLDSGGGVLEQMARPFRFFVGGPLGSGRQYMSWIHREDWVGLARFLLRPGADRGVFNATAPTPVTNAEFTQVLAAALGRPAFMRAPAFALRLVLGEMADPLLLSSQRVVPARALASGFTFRYPTLAEALGDIYKNVKS